MTPIECIMKYVYSVWPSQVTLIVGKLHALLALSRVLVARAVQCLGR